MPRAGGGLRSEVLSTRENGALVGAARNLTIGRRSSDIDRTKPRPGEAWQRDCWDLYDIVGEFRYAVNWVGNLLSRAKLTVLKNGEVTNDPAALAALKDFGGGPDGQAEILRNLGIHFTVAGDAYIFGYETKGRDEWTVAASTETTKTGGVWKVDGKSLGKGKPLAIYIWRPHPRRPSKADSPSRAVLPILVQLVQLMKHSSAQVDSRLSGAGILFLPSDMSFPARPARVQNPGDPDPIDAMQPGDAQSFAELLADVMGTAIGDRESAEARVPIIVQGDGEHLDKIKWQEFWTGLDENAAGMREELIRRIALGMDMPPEILTGTADVNHWGSWQIEEAAIKAHTEPLLQAIVSSLTAGYLRPVLDGDVDDPEAFSFGVDTSLMRLRPNRSKEAMEAHQMLALSGEAMLRENGFDIADAMSEDERRAIIIRRLVEGSPSPEQIAAAAKYLNIDLPGAAGDIGELVEVQDGTTPNRGSLEEHPVRDIPEEPTSDDVIVASLEPGIERLHGIADMMMLRALERCGNRLKAKMGARRPEGVAACDLYRVSQIAAGDLDDLLDDAWSWVERRDYGVDSAALRDTLDYYARSLLLSRNEYSPQDLAEAIEIRFGGAA